MVFEPESKPERKRPSSDLLLWGSESTLEYLEGEPADTEQHHGNTEKGPMNQIVGTVAISSITYRWCDYAVSRR